MRIIRPFESASLTGWDTSTVNWKQTGMMGRVQKPARAPFIATSVKFLWGKVYKVRARKTNIAIMTHLKINKNFWVRSMILETTKAPRMPLIMKETPIILDCFDVYPYGYMISFIMAPNPV